MGKPFAKGGKDGDVGKGKEKGMVTKGDCSKGKVNSKGKDGYRPGDTKGGGKDMVGKGKVLIAAKGKGVDGKGSEKGLHTEPGSKGKCLGSEAASQKGLGLEKGGADAAKGLGSKDGKGKGKPLAKDAGAGTSQGCEKGKKGESKGTAPPMLGSKDGKGKGQQGAEKGNKGSPKGEKGQEKGGTTASTGTAGATPTMETKVAVPTKATVAETTPAKKNIPSEGGGFWNICDPSL